jgi:pimeloyl-ACP methyl ester carboxylesterase
MLADATALLFDLAGAQSELMLNRLGGRLLGRIAPVARRKQPVVTIPGYMASDGSLATLNGFLNRQGFNARPWGMGRNDGLRARSWRTNFDAVSKHLSGVVRRLSDEASAPVALIGHSLGGVYARELAQRLQGDIDRVITLGSPTFHPYAENRHNGIVNALSARLNHQSPNEFGGRRGLLHWNPGDPELPCVAIHSPVDGFVNEDDCRIPDYILAQSTRRAPRENVRVLASHLGMTVNPWVLLAVADRLVADRRKWQPFDPQVYLSGGFSQVARLVFPRTGHVEPRPRTALLMESSQ